MTLENSLSYTCFTVITLSLQQIARYRYLTINSNSGYDIKKCEDIYASCHHIPKVQTPTLLFGKRPAIDIKVIRGTQWTSNN